MSTKHFSTGKNTTNCVAVKTNWRNFLAIWSMMDLKIEASPFDFSKLATIFLSSIDQTLNITIASSNIQSSKAKKMARESLKAWIFQQCPKRKCPNTRDPIRRIFSRRGNVSNGYRRNTSSNEIERTRSFRNEAKPISFCEEATTTIQISTTSRRRWKRALREDRPANKNFVAHTHTHTEISDISSGRWSFRTEKWDDAFVLLLLLLLLLLLFLLVARYVIKLR